MESEIRLAFIRTLFKEELHLSASSGIPLVLILKIKKGELFILRALKFLSAKISIFPLNPEPPQKNIIHIIETQKREQIQILKTETQIILSASSPNKI